MAFHLRDLVGEDSMPLRTTEIPHADLVRMLNEFNAIHEGWLISLEILSGSGGAQPEIVDLPLIGVTFDPARSGTMVITASRSLTDHVTHVIQAPTRVWIARNETGADAALEIESADGTKTILRFRTAALPETVDGVTPPH